MKTKAIENKFNKAYKAEYLKQQSNVENVLEKAADKKFALGKHAHKFHNEYLNFQKTNSDLFPFLKDIESELKLEKDQTFFKVIAESKEFKTEGNVFIENLAVMKAMYDFSRELHDRFSDFKKVNSLVVNEDEPDTSFKFEWNGKLSQRDFAKIFYALKEDGYLKGEITKIVPAAAKALNFELGLNWEANFSKGKKYVNANFSHDQIFDSLKDAFNEYYNRQVDDQMKRNK